MNDLVEGALLTWVLGVVACVLLGFPLVNALIGSSVSTFVVWMVFLVFFYEGY